MGLRVLTQVRGEQGVIYRAYVGGQYMDEIYRGSFFKGGHGGTNNACEWRALICGFQQLVRLGIREVDVEGDAEIVVKQWKDVYATRNTQLQCWVERQRLSFDSLC